MKRAQIVDGCGRRFPICRPADLPRESTPKLKRAINRANAHTIDRFAWALIGVLIGQGGVRALLELHHGVPWAAVRTDLAWTAIGGVVGLVVVTAVLWTFGARGLA